VKVAAINSAGTGPYSGSTGALIPATAAFAVGALTAAPGNEEVVLSWIPLTTAQLGGGAFMRYEVNYRVAGPGSWDSFDDNLAVQSTSTITVTGLSNSVSYDFQVVAITVANDEEFAGNTAEVVQYPSTVPSAPQGATVLALSATEVQFSWSSPLSDGGSELISPNYTVTVTESAGADAVTCATSGNQTNCVPNRALTNGEV
jgi:hypothetical protein